MSISETLTAARNVVAVWKKRPAQNNDMYSALVDLAAALDKLGAAPTGPTIRVRIAVAVDVKGDWSANGWPARPGREKNLDAERASLAQEGLDSGHPQHIVWVEANAPLPIEQTVEGEVSK